MAKKLLLALLGLIFAFTASRAVVKIMEPGFLFHPVIGLEANPGFYGMKYMDVVMQSGGGRIHGWYLPKPEAYGFIVYFHGNGGNLAHSLGFLKFIEPMKAHVLAIDYNGYGKSEGEPSIEKVAENAVSAVEWLHKGKNIPLDRIILWGWSLGAGAALEAAEKYPGVAGIILESSFVSMRRMALEIYPWMPVALVTGAFDNGQAVSTLSAPKLFIHGAQDRVIPFSHSRQLFEMALEPKAFIAAQGAGHANVYQAGGQDYFKAVEAWVYARFADSWKKPEGGKP
ncbi:MAG: alpha/beta fold hydrolase [Nitrospinae bacterium]|nr:alpha/beta fold hydrolase [Nitrospinota bacterium]